MFYHVSQPPRNLGVTGMLQRNNEHFLKKRKYEKLRLSEMNHLNLTPFD